MFIGGGWRDSLLVPNSWVNSAHVCLPNSPGETLGLPWWWGFGAQQQGSSEDRNKTTVQGSESPQMLQMDSGYLER